MKMGRIILVAAIASITACKVQVEVPVEGSVTTISTLGDCAAGQVCTLDVADSTFDETFTAVPAEGWQFAGWKQGNTHLCSGSQAPCNYNTSVFEGNEDVTPFLENQDIILRVEPVFVSDDAEPEEILGATLNCPWDESDPTLHVFLAAGQSNMVSVYGQPGTLPAKYETGTDQLQMWDEGSWKRLGLSTENGNDVPRYGPELGFAWTLHAACPDSNIGIIKYAVGGTSISTWIPGGENSAVLVSNITAAFQAHSDITFEGYLYKQGGGDANNRNSAEAWGDNFLSIVDAFRNHPVIPDDFPFLVASPRGDGDVFPDDITDFDPDSIPSPDPSRPFILHVIHQQWMVQFERPDIYPVIERDIPIGADGIHQTPEGIRMVGRGFAETYANEAN